MAGATETFARWVHELRFEDIPEEAVENARQQLLSIVGAMFAGSLTEAGVAIAAAVREWGEREESTVVGSGYRCSMRSAGLVNSVNAQVLEFEDWVGVVHAGATVVPTALAVAEATGADGRRLLTAQVAGNEIAARVGLATIGGRGGGNAHAVHQVEVPLIAGKLLGLEPLQLMDAVGGSCAQAQFPATISWTSHAKGYLTGMPVYTGIAAANIARHGFGGNHEIVEHPQGYCVEAQGLLHAGLLTQGLGERWYLADAFTNKPYPMCGFTMAPADCLLDLVRENDIAPEDIEEIVVRCPITFVITGTWWNATPDLYDRIRRGRETGWSWIPLLFDAYYPLAAAVVDREITPRQFGNERIFDPRIQSLLGRIRLEHDADLDAALLRGIRFGAEVIIVTKDGRRISKATEQHRGGPDNPIDAAEKFTTATRDVLDDARRNAIIETVGRVERLGDVRELTALLG